MNDIMTPVGIDRKIACRRIEKGLSKQILAKACGVTLTYITMVERGIAKPTRSMINNIMSVLQ